MESEVTVPSVSFPEYNPEPFCLCSMSTWILHPYNAFNTAGDPILHYGYTFLFLFFNERIYIHSYTHARTYTQTCVLVYVWMLENNFAFQTIINRIYYYFSFRERYYNIPVCVAAQ